MLVNLDTKVVFLFEQGYMFLNPVVRRAAICKRKFAGLNMKNDQRWILRSPRSASTMCQ